MLEPPRTISIEWRGRERYQTTWDRQLELHELRRKGEIGDMLVFVEHEPVITLGKRGDSTNLVVTQAVLEQRRVDFHQIGRGGDITFHGPGQLVGYLVVDLRKRGLKVRGFIRLVEQAIIKTLTGFNIRAATIPGLTGVWFGDTKLAAIGIEVKGGVSLHGLALNVHTDLAYYDLIVPCGIKAKQVGSIASVLGKSIGFSDVRYALGRDITQALLGLGLG